MRNLKRFVILLLALVILIGTTGFVPQSALAYGCTRYHTVRVGQTLSWIGRYYGVNWTYLARINGIRWPYTVYIGQSICISTTGGGTGGWYYPTSSTTSAPITTCFPEMAIVFPTHEFAPRPSLVLSVVLPCTPLTVAALLRERASPCAPPRSLPGGSTQARGCPPVPRAQTRGPSPGTAARRCAPGPPAGTPRACPVR